MRNGSFALLGETTIRAGIAYRSDTTRVASDRPWCNAFAPSETPTVTTITPLPAEFFSPIHWAAALRRIIVRVTKLGSAIPMPAVLKRHVSKREAAFIAAAYAIPLPGTALIAALMVGVRLLYRRLRSRCAERSLALVENG